MRTWSPCLAFGRWLLLILTVAAILGPVEIGVVAADRQKQVLVLYSTRRDAQIAVLGDSELPRILDRGLQEGLDFYSEYIDRARFPDPEYQAGFGDFLQLKYKGQRFDLIIAMSDLAIQFIDKTRSDLFPDTPVVFFTDSPATRRIANSSGVIAELAFSGTVALAVELQPDIRQVFVVSGAETGDKQFEREARSQLESFEPRLTVTYLSGLPTKELESRLATLPDHSMVYFLLVTRDGAGENFHPLTYVDRVTAVARAPTYSWVDSTMDHGIVGGSLKSQETEIAAVAHLALRVLHGERADSIPLSLADLNVRQVDWRQLRRWGISDAHVPAGTMVLFREPSAWDRYASYIVTAAVLLVAQAALIAGLLVQGARRRRAEVRLRASRAELSIINARLQCAVEGERFRIARELHDDVGQRMAALTIGLDGLGAVLPMARPDWCNEIRALSSRSRELATDIQAISRSLHTSKLDYLGLVSASADICLGISEQQNIAIQFSSRDIPDDVPTDAALCLLRVLQEAVNNAVKHARARRITVALWGGGDEIRLEVADDGIGIDPDAAMSGPGLGLISMQERLSLVKGEMRIESRPRAGVTIRAQVPLRGAGRLSVGAA